MKFIYIMDAYDDLEADIRRGRYNPLKDMSLQDDYEDRVLESLTLLIAESTDAFETLPLVKDMDILRNILYAGCAIVKSRCGANAGRAYRRPARKARRTTGPPKGIRRTGHERPLRGTGRVSGRVRR